VVIISWLVAGGWWLGIGGWGLVSGFWFLVPDPTRITKEAVQAILGASLGQRMPVSNLMRFSVDGQRETSCSVPLIEVQIPKDTNFVITQVPPPSNFTDNKPVAHGLPACPTGTSR
jgi:hypothetical protein